MENLANDNANVVDKDVLISIRNLKQYFPIKSSKKEFVKANDGITIDIYKGETLGIVGESGCGKSTLGRVLLQLYRQTEGETMYYGHSRDEIAPKYAEDTYKNLERNIKKSHELREKAEKLTAEHDALEKNIDLNNKEAADKLYNLKAELNIAVRDAHNAVLNIAELVGGFYTTTNYGEVSAAFLAHYEACSNLSKLKAQISVFKLDMEDYAIKVYEAEKKGVSGSSFEAKAKEFAEKIKAKTVEIDAAKVKVAEMAEKIEKIREPYKSDEKFIEYEKLRDEGINLARLNYNEMRQLRNELQLIFQDPYSSLNPRFTVGQIIGEGLLNHGFYKRHSEKMQDYVMKTMEDCGLQPYMIHRYPHQFSGGQRQRIGIARSLAVQPKFVVCDEAVSALDVSIQSQVINLLMELKERDNLTYMFISHDLSVVKYISDRIAVMYLGNIVELADSQTMFENPLHPYTEALLAAIPTTDVENVKEPVLLEGDIPSPINPPKGCKFHTRCRYCMDICKVVTPEFIESEPNHFVACHHVMEKDK